MKQLAFLIGNNNYSESPLGNCVNDARALGTKLGELGFESMLAADATCKEMDRALAEYGSRLKAHEVGLFFFAGHGMQIDGENYLTAIDTKFSTELDAKYSSLPLNKVIETMEAAGNRTSILILDACRTNPYERRWRGVSRGLAPVYAPKGMIVAYATSPGQVASDGIGANGAYTHALLAHIDQQDLSIESFFKRVRNTLSSSTAGKQISWEHTSLMGDYYFNYASTTVTGVTAYSAEALADTSFAPLRGTVGGLIGRLKTHDWYQQNPAISAINTEALTDAGKDECFVLGRNIYQAACGSANTAVNFLTHLNANLARLPENVAFHVLNGVLFEIYFDSSGLKRKKAKTGRIDEVFALEEDPARRASFEFIQKKLIPYRDALFYMPATLAAVCLDIVITTFNGKPTVKQICFEGENILYTQTGEGYFELNEFSASESDTQESFRAKLSEALATPIFRLRISYVGQPLTEEKFSTPWLLNLQRFASK